MKLTEITLDGDLQIRDKINDEAVDAYTEVLREGGKLPPVTIFSNGSSNLLADGWHRYFAHKKAGLALIEVSVIQGGKRDAIKFAAGANDTHGVRRTNADKQNAVRKMLDDMEWSELSDREIAKICKVSNVMVSAMRKKNDPQPVAKAQEYPVPKELDEPTIPTDHKEDELKEMAETIASLADDLERAERRVAVAAMEATDEEKGLAQEKFLALEAEVKDLRQQIVHLTARRDSLMVENNELKKQIKKLEKQIYAMRKQYEVA